MLAPADAAVARRDTAIPGLALVLDPEAIADRLRVARPATGPTSARVRYVRYKPGTSCLVGLELEVAGRWTPAFAKAYRCDDRTKLAKASDRSSGELTTFETELAVVGRTADDRDLRLPSRLADPGTRGQLLRSLLPREADLWKDEPRCLRYKPERRWVGLVARSGEPVALVKGYRGSDLARARAGLSFARTIPVATPRLIGRSNRAGAVASSWLSGVPLSELCGGVARSVEDFSEVGQALAALHAQPPGDLSPSPPIDDADAVIAAAAGVGALVPESSSMVARLGVALARRLDAGSVAMTPRHGDFSPDQVIIGASRIAFIDFDRSGVGDPATDLGQFVATLELDALRGLAGAGALEARTATLLDGYRSAGGQAASERVALHVAASLVRLAVEPFRLRWADWPEATKLLLERAATVSPLTARP